MNPLAIDLYCGLGGWTEGLLNEGYEVVGFDIERHVYGESKYPAQLVLQDVTTLHGSQFKHAALIVASPPCQFFSYCAMPWKRAKALAEEVRTDPTRLEKELALFSACFRIQREASGAAGHHIPMVVENVKGAQPWVGRAQANFGSFYLWGDISMVGQRIVPPCPQFGTPSTRAYRGVAEKFNPDGTKHPQGSWSAVADSKNRGAQKIVGYSDPRRNGGLGAHRTSQSENDGRAAVGQGVKQPGHSGRAWFADSDVAGHLSSHSSARKAASAQIARIPFELARWVARTYRLDVCFIRDQPGSPEDRAPPL